MTEFVDAIAPVSVAEIKHANGFAAAVVVHEFILQPNWPVVKHFIGVESVDPIFYSNYLMLEDIEFRIKFPGPGPLQTSGEHGFDAGHPEVSICNKGLSKLAGLLEGFV